jgi:hypothetical protein
MMIPHGFRLLLTACVLPAAGGCLPLLLDDLTRVSGEFNELRTEASPAAGTYRVTYAFADGDTATVYARTLARPTVPVVDLAPTAGLRPYTAILLGYLLPTFVAGHPDMLPGTITGTEYVAAALASGGMLAVGLTAVGDALPGSFPGGFGLLPGAGDDPVADRRREALARWREPYLQGDLGWSESPGSTRAPEPWLMLGGLFVAEPGHDLTIRQIARPAGAPEFHIAAERISTDVVSVHWAGGLRQDASIGLAPGVRRGHFRNSRYVALAYTTDLPHIPFGAGMYGIRPNGISPFIDVKFAPHPDPFYADREEGLRQAELRGHAVREVRSSWVSLAAGATRTMGPGLAVFGGLGVAWRNEDLGFRGEHSRWDGPTYVWGHGDYWVHNRSFLDPTPSLLGGAFIRVHGNWLGQVGFQSRPRGLIAGIGYGLPYFYPIRPE